MPYVASKTFEQWCKENSKEKFLEQWSEKNTKKPNEMGFGSHYRAIFVCDCGEEYTSAPHTIAMGKKHPCCKKCAFELSGIKNRQTRNKNKETAYEWCVRNNRQEIINQWSDKNELTLHDLSYNSNYYAWFVCEKDGYEWQAHLGTRINQNTDCPVCANKVVVKGLNDLETWCKQNFKEHLIDEFDKEKNKKLGITLHNITAGSSKRVWWKIHKVSKFLSIRERTGFSHKERISFGSTRKNNHCGIFLPEKAIAFYLEKHFDIKESYKPDFLGQKEIDIYIPSLKIGIEYDGSGFHKDIQKDLFKNDLCKKNGIRLIRIREYKCPILPSYIEHMQLKDDTTKELGHAIVSLFDILGIKDADINMERDRIEILQKVRLTVYRNSFKNWCIKNKLKFILDMWHPTLNGTLKPEHFSECSAEKMWFICDKGHPFQKAIQNIYKRKKCECPYCTCKDLLKGYNDLETFCKKFNQMQILERWDYELNEISPSDIVCGSGTKAWWKKPNSKVVFQSIHSRTGKIIRELKEKNEFNL